VTRTGVVGVDPCFGPRAVCKGTSLSSNTRPSARAAIGAATRKTARAPSVTSAHYFPTKEDLFYSGLEAFEEELLTAIRERPIGESVLVAFGRFVLQERGLRSAKEPERVQRLAAIVRVISESPALLAREQEIFADYTASLAGLLAEEARARPGSVEPWVVANALIGVHRALVQYSRTEVLAGTRNPTLIRRVRTQGKAALAALDEGLRDYGIKQG
jgi:AcrR family transcriptional regulator